MSGLFERAHAFTAEFEGGYVWHKNDPGGETNLGVTRRVWEQWCVSQRLPCKPMRQLTTADVLPLYRARYWAPYAEPHPWPLSAAAYDICVNHGHANLAYMLRQSGKPGTSLERALALCDVRERFYRDIVKRRPTQIVFLRGWLRRVNAQRAWLRANADAQPGVLLVPPKGGRPVAWNGRPDRFGGVILTPELMAQLDTVYPLPGGPWTYDGKLRVWRRENGDLVLERLPSTASR